MCTVAAFLEKLPLLGSLREIPLSSQRVFPVRTAQGLTPRVADTQHHFLCQENVAIISQKQTLHLLRQEGRHSLWIQVKGELVAWEGKDDQGDI